MSLAPDRRSLRLPDFDYSIPGQVYFVTLRAVRPLAKRWQAPFRDAGLANEIIASLRCLRDQKGVKLLCFCLMPDHLHALLAPGERSGSLIDVIGDLKSFTTRAAWSHGWTGRLWARSFHDHAIRTAGDLIEACRYVLANPVRAGLVESGEEYPYSEISDSLPI
jgi:putative transposase